METGMGRVMESKRNWKTEGRNSPVQMDALSYFE